MNVAHAHERHADDVGAYLLGALEESEERAFEHHLHALFRGQSRDALAIGRERHVRHRRGAQEQNGRGSRDRSGRRRPRRLAAARGDRDREDRERGGPQRGKRERHQEES